MIRHIYKEEFFSMDSVDKYGHHQVYSVYVNPSMREYEKFIYPQARAMIDKFGNLYVEGDENKDPREEYNPSVLFHEEFIQTVAKKIHLPYNFHQNYPYNYYGDESNYGIGVYSDDPETLRVSTTYLTAVDLHLDTHQAKILFDRCREHNPQIKTLMMSKVKVLFQV